VRNCTLGLKKSVKLGRYQKPITAPRQSLDEDGLVGSVAQRNAQLHDGRIDASVKLDDCAVGPEMLADFVARNQVPVPFQQDAQKLKLLLGEADIAPVVAQVRSRQIEFEASKAN
jgi:hypothetical protein